MLYAKLRSLRSINEEIKYWMEKLQDAQAGDPLTNAGMRKKNKVPKIREKLNECRSAYDKLKVEILKDGHYNNMPPHLKEGCKAYYFNSKTEIEAKEISSCESFLRDVRNYCHKLK